MLAPAAAGAAVMQLALSPGRARAYYGNLVRIIPETSNSRRRRAILTYKALRSYGLFLLEFLKISKMEQEVFMREFRFDCIGDLDRALDEGRGVILIATHLGNWEAGARALAYAGYKIHIVVGVQLNRSLSPYMKNLKREVGVGVVSPKPGEYRRLIEALRDNEIVVLAVDGDTFEKGLEVPFFRGRTRAAAGPARLAALTGAPVVATHVLRERPMSFRMKFETLWDGEGGAHGLSPQGGDFVPRLTEYIMGSLEAPIEANLDQWCIFRPLWNGTDGK
jgi:KDO2-lipid IV(A) lauroyltransferase